MIEWYIWKTFYFQNTFNFKIEHLVLVSLKNKVTKNVNYFEAKHNEPRHLNQTEEIMHLYAHPYNTSQSTKEDCFSELSVLLLYCLSAGGGQSSAWIWIMRPPKTTGFEFKPPNQYLYKGKEGTEISANGITKRKEQTKAQCNLTINRCMLEDDALPRSCFTLKD